MKVYKVFPIMSDESADKLAGEFLDDEAYNLLLDKENADVYDAETGAALLHFRKRKVRQNDALTAFDCLYDAATEYGNRGIAAGKMKYRNTKDSKEARAKKAHNVDEKDVRFKYVKRDGTVSKTNLAMTVPSGIVGAFDRNPRYPFCRLSKFTVENYDKVMKAMPFVRQVDAIFRENSPERYANQLEAANRTHKDYLFSGTAFSTITVNRNWRTAVHKDAGDLQSGFGVLSVLSRGLYSGGYFILPKYGVAVNIGHGDVLLADVHQWHCNTELVGISKHWTRLSCVFYFRKKIVGCQSLEQEIEISKRRKEGMPMYGDYKGEFPE